MSYLRKKRALYRLIAQKMGDEDDEIRALGDKLLQDNGFPDEVLMALEGQPVTLTEEVAIIVNGSEKKRKKQKRLLDDTFKKVVEALQEEISRKKFCSRIQRIDSFGLRGSKCP